MRISLLRCFSSDGIKYVCQDCHGILAEKNDSLSKTIYPGYTCSHVTNHSNFGFSRKVKTYALQKINFSSSTEPFKATGYNLDTVEMKG